MWTQRWYRSRFWYWTIFGSPHNRANDSRCCKIESNMTQPHAEIQVVIGQTRGAGATTIVRALGVKRAQQNKRTLLIDLDLWTVELSASFHQSQSKFVTLAEQYWHDAILRSDAIAEAIVPIAENLRLLPNHAHWLASSYLGGTAGYDFIRALLDALSTAYDSIVVDLGASVADPNSKTRSFLPGCAAHLAAVESASRIFYLFSYPSEYEKWRVETPRVEHPEKIFLLINRAKKQKRELLTIGSFSIPILFVKQSSELEIDPTPGS